MINYNDKFKSDLFTGQIGEKVIADYFKLKYWNTLSFNNTNTHDIIIEKDGIEIKLEVKTDLYEYFKGITTNNMFIEVKCNGHISGLSATKADFFIYYYPAHEVFYLIKIDKLRTLIRERGDLFHRAECCGDKGKVTGYIMNRFNQDFFKSYHIDFKTFEDAYLEAIEKEKDKI